VSALDSVTVDEREKVAAQNLHGADAAALKVTRAAAFPRGELDDGGGALPPIAAGLLASDGSKDWMRVDASGKSQAGAGEGARLARADGVAAGVPAAVARAGVLALGDFLKARSCLQGAVHVPP
jgi:hypothetical protein